MNLSPQRKLLLAMLAFVVIGLAIGAVSVATQAEFLTYVFFGWVIIGSVLMFLIRCPKCGAPVVLQERIFRFPLLAGLTARRCRTCGEDLTKPKITGRK